MEAKKQDLRVQKTLAAINRAFEEMVCTMPPQEITVKELTERAKINRKTFYLHYTCIEHVYEEAIRRLADGYIEIMGKTEIDNGSGAFNMKNLTQVFLNIMLLRARLPKGLSAIRITGRILTGCGALLCSITAGSSTLTAICRRKNKTLFLPISARQITKCTAAGCWTAKRCRCKKLLP